jgi:ribose transport system ATP-binding protein
VQSMLSIEKLSKSFAGNRVLCDFDLDVAAGEIHGLIGQNGAGKSTLVKILSGYHSADSGRIRVQGKSLSNPVSRDQLRRLGLSFVHQSLALVDDLSVADNLFVEDYPIRLGHRIDKRGLYRSADALLGVVGFDVPSGAPVSSLSAAQKAVLAIVRAGRLGSERNVLVLDEPTARLAKDESTQVFAAMRDLADRGGSVLFISHRLDEVLALTDRVTVLREGKVVERSRTRDTSESELIAALVGSPVEELYPHRGPTGESMLQVRELSGGMLNKVSFDLKAGEVVGLTGLDGMGFDEVPYLLLAREGPQCSGSVTIDGRAFDLSATSIRQRIESGLALVPGDRTTAGLATSLTVRENISLSCLRNLTRGPMIDLKRERRFAADAVAEFQIRPPRLEVEVGSLSGGNQQKVMLAKSLRNAPRVLLAHEPTQGVDVGARKQIFDMIASLSSQGVGVLISSIEYEDLARLCHRVYVFRHGRICGVLSATDGLTKDRILRECYSSSVGQA